MSQSKNKLTYILRSFSKCEKTQLEWFLDRNISLLNFYKSELSELGKININRYKTTKNKIAYHKKLVKAFRILINYPENKHLKNILIN